RPPINPPSGMPTNTGPRSCTNLFYTALKRFRDEQGLGPRKKKFRFKNKLLSLDSTTIWLCLELFPWAKFRRAKGGVKAHVLLDHDDYLPSYVLITEAKCSDLKMAQSLDLNVAPSWPSTGAIATTRFSASGTAAGFSS